MPLLDELGAFTGEKATAAGGDWIVRCCFVALIEVDQGLIVVVVVVVVVLWLVVGPSDGKMRMKRKRSCLYSLAMYLNKIPFHGGGAGC